MTRRLLLAALLALLLLPAAPRPAAACVGKTLIIGTLPTEAHRLAAQVIAILINERTGTTVKIVDYETADDLYRQLTGGDVDIAVEFPGNALARLGVAVPGDPAAAYAAAKSEYMEKLNLVWLPPLGFSDPGGAVGQAAPVAQKHTLQKFPALPRLIAKTQDLLPDPVMQRLAAAGEPARAAREFLRQSKLI